MSRQVTCPFLLVEFGWNIILFHASKMRIFPHILKRGAQKKIVLKIAAAVFLVTVVHLLELYSLTLCTKKPKNNANHFNYDGSPAIAFFSLIKFLVK